MRIVLLLILIIFQVNVITEATVQVLLQIVHHFLDFFTSYFGLFDFLQIRFFGLCQKFLRPRKVMRNENFPTEKRNLCIIVKKLDFLDSFFEIFQLILFRFNFFLKILEFCIVICKFINFLLIIKCDIDRRILKKCQN